MPSVVDLSRRTRSKHLNVDVSYSVNACGDRLKSIQNEPELLVTIITGIRQFSGMYSIVDQVVVTKKN